jgi:hypothetical protein
VWRRRVSHILHDGTIEPNEVTEDRLLAVTRRTEGDLLASREDPRHNFDRIIAEARQPKTHQRQAR